MELMERTELKNISTKGATTPIEVAYQIREDVQL